MSVTPTVLSFLSCTLYFGTQLYVILCFKLMPSTIIFDGFNPIGWKINISNFVIIKEEFLWWWFFTFYRFSFATLFILILMIYFTFLCRCVNVLLTNPIWVVVTRMQVSGSSTPIIVICAWHGSIPSICICISNT